MQQVVSEVENLKAKNQRRKGNQECLAEEKENQKEKGQRNVHDLDLSLIMKWEGYREYAYLCQAGKWTVGYGSTFLTSKNRSVKEGDSLSKDKALEELHAHVSKSILPKIEEVEKSHGEIPKSLKESLCSLAYNEGSSCLNSQTFKKALDAKDAREMASWFRMWRLVKGEVNEGLVNRRNDEVEHFQHRIWVA